MKKYILVYSDAEIYSSDCLDAIVRIFYDRDFKDSMRLFVHSDGFYCDVTDVLYVCYAFIKKCIRKEDV